jgi:hypothetical protein
VLIIAVVVIIRGAAARVIGESFELRNHTSS